MSDRNLTTEVVKDAVTFPRTRLGEPRTINAEDFDRWLARVKKQAAAEAVESFANTFQGDSYQGSEIAARGQARATVYREQVTE